MDKDYYSFYIQGTVLNNGNADAHNVTLSFHKRPSIAKTVSPKNLKASTAILLS